MKVYISKSNLSHMDDLILLRNLFRDLDVEVLEFHGGKYNKHIMDDANMVFVLPPANNFTYRFDGSLCLHTGKGSGSEVEYIIDRKCKDVIILAPGEDHFYRIEKVEVTGVRWQDDYYRLLLNDTYYNLNEVKRILRERKATIDEIEKHLKNGRVPEEPKRVDPESPLDSFFKD